MKFKWTVEFTIDEIWVADGFDLTSIRAKEMLAKEIAYALDHEISAKTIFSPSAKAIATAQGFKSVRAMKRAA